MKHLSWQCAILMMVIALFSIAMANPAENGADEEKSRVKRGLFGPTFGLGIKSSILSSLFGKGGVIDAKTSPGLSDATNAAENTQPGTVATPLPPMFPLQPFLQNIMQAKFGAISSKFAATPAADFGTAAPTSSSTFEHVELVSDIETADPAASVSNKILGNILKATGPLSSSSSDEYDDY